MTPSPPLPPGFLDRPFAHRGLHDKSKGVIENSASAVAAAVAAGYGIEVDIQPSADGRAMVFHDYDLARLTGTDGRVSDLSAVELERLPLAGGNGDGVPTLRHVLDLAQGRVPLLIEIKDQDGAMGPNIGALSDAVAADLAHYAGPVAMMSFNPHAVAAFGVAAPHIPRGLTANRFLGPKSVASIPAPRRAELARLDAFDAVGAAFVSWGAYDFPDPAPAAVRAKGVPVLCWTIRTPDAARIAAAHADAITFEGFAP